MQKKNYKSMTMSGILLLAILFVIAIAMLINFTRNSREMLDATIENGIEKDMETHAARISGAMGRVTGATETVGAILEDATVKRRFATRDALAAIAASSDAYMSVFCNLNGTAITGTTGTVILAQAEYMDKLQGEESFFLYVTDDGITGDDAIMYVCPVKGEGEVEGYVLSFMENDLPFDEVRETAYDNRAFFALVDYAGNIQYCWSDGKQEVPFGENVWADIKESVVNASDWTAFDRNLQREEACCIHINIKGDERLICVLPLEETGWALMMGLEEDYLKERGEAVWDSNRKVQIGIFAILIVILGVFIYFNFATRIHASEHSRNLESKADTDQLTGLNNKIATERKIREYIAENPGGMAVMVILDVDNFKKINDTMGHSFGDEVLRSLGHQLRVMFRVSDILGRAGGDEFILLLKNLKDDAAVEKEGRKLEDFFHQFEVGEYVKYSVTASLGAAVFPRDAATFEDLYKAADAALYTAKRRGKNQLAFYGKERTDS